ncbi:hemerythrin domain-containing protein [Caulobacter sp. 1776]|uniref:hemerythrin domain-containing protein n=1 Tax=Caulobacter sp. 1776 TaxID=3156420 RepID=UPI003399511C
MSKAMFGLHWGKIEACRIRRRANLSKNKERIGDRAESGDREDFAMTTPGLWTGPYPDLEWDDAELIEDVFDHHRQHICDLALALALARGLATRDRRVAKPLADGLAELMAELWRHQIAEARLLSRRPRDREALQGSLMQLSAEHDLVRERLSALTALAGDLANNEEAASLRALLERYDGEFRDDLRLEEGVVFTQLTTACAGATSDGSRAPIHLGERAAASVRNER